MASQTEQIIISYAPESKVKVDKPFKSWDKEFLKLGELVMSGQLDDSLSDYPLEFIHFAYQDAKDVLNGISKVFLVEKNDEKSMLVYSAFLTSIYSKNKKHISSIPVQNGQKVKYGPFNSNDFLFEINTHSLESANRFKQLISYVNR